MIIILFIIYVIFLSARHDVIVYLAVLLSHEAQVGSNRNIADLLGGVHYRLRRYLRNYRNLHIVRWFSGGIPSTDAAYTSSQ